MKRLAVIMILATIGAAAFAAPYDRPLNPFQLDEAFLRAEVDQALAGERDTAVGTLTVGQLQELLGRLSVAQQKAAFIARSRTMSLMMPGLGQFANKDAVSGALFLTADLALIAGTLVGAYYLLPPNVRFDRLDYFYGSFRSIRDTWESNSFMDYLPSLGVLAGGWLLQAVLGGISAHHAEKLARRNIEQGKITFEPRLLLAPRGHMGMGWGMGWDLRY
jgi:hypothetical protein